MRSSTTSHKNQFFRRLEDKDNCYKELKKKTNFYWSKSHKSMGNYKGINKKMFSLPCKGKTNELRRRKETMRL